MGLNRLELNLRASGPEDRAYGYHQVDHFDRTGNFPAHFNRVGNVRRAAPVQGIFDRCHRLHPGRGGAARTTRKLRHPSVVQVDLLQPVRLHDRLQVWARILCLAQPPHPVASRRGPRHQRHRPDPRSRLRLCFSSGCGHGCRPCVGQPHPVFHDRNGDERADAARAFRRCVASAAGQHRGRLCGYLYPWLHPDAAVRALCRTLADGH